MTQPQPRQEEGQVISTVAHMKSVKSELETASQIERLSARISEARDQSQRSQNSRIQMGLGT